MLDDNDDTPRQPTSSKYHPPRPIHEPDALSDNDKPAKQHGAAFSKENQPARPTIIAIRIPADGSPPYAATLELVKATSDYHFNRRDPNPLHHSLVHSHMNRFLKPTAEIDFDQLHDSIGSVYQRAGLPPRRLKRYHRLRPSAFGYYIGPPLDFPVAGMSKIPRLTFTHASLRFQPNVIDEFWGSGEAWKYRAFKRLYARPRQGANLDMLQGEYHIMYTFALVRDLRPNVWSNMSVLGDAFVLKMASGKNEAGDWYYEDAQPEILDCSLKEQCLEALRSVRPVTFETMVGERGKQPPGKISHGTGLSGRAVQAFDENLCGLILCLRRGLTWLSA